jgi:hypothetical protein
MLQENFLHLENFDQMLVLVGTKQLNEHILECQYLMLNNTTHKRQKRGKCGLDNRELTELRKYSKNIEQKTLRFQLWVLKSKLNILFCLQYDLLLIKI